MCCNVRIDLNCFTAIRSDFKGALKSIRVQSSSLLLAKFLVYLTVRFPNILNNDCENAGYQKITAETQHDQIADPDVTPSTNPQTGKCDKVQATQNQIAEIVTNYVL